MLYNARSIRKVGNVLPALKLRKLFIKKASFYLIELGKIQFAKVFRLTGNCWLDKRRCMPITGEEIKVKRIESRMA